MFVGGGKEGLVAGERKGREVTVRLTLCFRWTELLLHANENLLTNNESRDIAQNMVEAMNRIPTNHVRGG